VCVRRCEYKKIYGGGGGVTEIRLEKSFAKIGKK